MSYQTEALRLPLAEIRWELHRHPEMGRKEYRTAACIEKVLGDAGIETLRICDTAVVGIIRGAHPGKTVALRADMDALPVTERTGCDFASENEGIMHACGHDCHMTAALGAALLLQAKRKSLHGNVKLFFQPDEEGNGGAERMMAAGCLEDPHADAVFGFHVAPELPAGTVGVRYGKFYAASNMIHAEVTGRASHGAEPEKGVNALTAAADMLMQIEQLRSRLQEKHGRLIITVGKLLSGTACNILPGEAMFEGIIRTLGPDARRETIGELRALLERIAEEHGTKLRLEIRESYPGVVNHDAETALVERTARAVLGDERVIVLQEPTMTTEDFGYFLQERPGSFYAFGVGGDVPLHNPCFLADEKLLPAMAALEAELAERYLNT